MTDVTSHPAVLHDPRLATHATAATPVWLWSTDATRMLWANPVGAAIFDEPAPAALAARRFDTRDQAAAQIARLAATLPLGGAPRLERLRGFGGGLWRALTCACSRIALTDHTPAILVVATEPAGPSLTLAERVCRLFAGTGPAVAAFAPDGALIHATPEGRARLGPHATLGALGAAALAEEALASGRAAGETPLGRLTLERLGTEASSVLVAIFAEPPPATRLARATSVSPDVVAGAPHPTQAGRPAATPQSPTVAGEKPQMPRVDLAASERRHPLRFIWQMDAAGRFTLGSDEFIEMIGPSVAATLGRPWMDITRELALDPEGQVARAVATHETWSGITVSWPVDGSADRLKAELSGLPVYDRNRSFAGYRGFGVCRDVDHIATLARMRHPVRAVTPQPALDKAAPTPASSPAADASPELRPTLTVVPTAPNVVPFRGSAPASEAKAPALSPGERSAFHELARQLNARLKGDEAEGVPAEAAAGAAQRLIGAGQSPSAPAVDAQSASARLSEWTLLERMPIGVLVHRRGTPLYANRAFLDWSGHADFEALAEGGSLEGLFAEGGAHASGEASGADVTLAIATRYGDKRPVEGRLVALPWEGEAALALVLLPSADEERRKPNETARQLGEPRTGELQSALDAAERDLTAARVTADKTSAIQSAFLAKVSHEIRTPLNSIIGFADVMLEERFGPIGNERYREYLKDICASGEHALALLNDLVDLAKIEAGKLELAFTDLNINETVQGCVSLLQPQATRERIIIRTSLAARLPPATADANAVRQIALNLLANSIRFTSAGGQVIVSTAQSGAGEPVLRVRDSGIGMNEKELAAALAPFRAPAVTTRWDASGTGLSLPLTKALAEANRARFTISSKVNEGTLVEVAFAPARARAE